MTGQGSIYEPQPQRTPNVSGTGCPPWSGQLQFGVSKCLGFTSSLLPENNNSLHSPGLPAHWEDTRQTVVCSLVLTLCQTLCVGKAQVLNQEQRHRIYDLKRQFMRPSAKRWKREPENSRANMRERTARSTQNRAVPTSSHAHTYMVRSHTTLVCFKHFHHLRVWEGKTE